MTTALPKPLVSVYAIGNGGADGDLTRRVDTDFAVGACREAISAVHRGELTAPPRVHAELGDGRLTYTAGRLTGRWFGYLSYDRIGPADGNQLVAVHREDDGVLAGIAVGHELGRMRTCPARGAVLRGGAGRNRGISAGEAVGVLSL